MATRVVVFRTDIERSPVNVTQVNVAVTAVIIGAQTGNYLIPDVKTLVQNVDVANDATMRNQIGASIQAELVANGVTFSSSDSVQVL